MTKVSFRKKLWVIRKILLSALKKKFYMSHLWITRKCNIHCKFCYVRDYSGTDPSLEELQLRLDKLREIGCKVTVIMGGEPTLRKDLPQIVSACKERKILSYLVTNGTLLNRELMDTLGQAGLDVISISFDALEFKDNLLIKYGKYECDPKEKLELLKYAQEKYDILAFVAICITRHNLDEIIPLMQVAQNYHLAITITVMADPYIIPDQTDPHWKSEKEEVLFQRNEERKKLKTLIQKLRKMKQEGARIIEPLSYFDRIDAMLSGEKVSEIACKAGDGFLDINTDGNIMLCVMSDPIPVHYSELTAQNVKAKLKPYREKQLSQCAGKCMLAAYYDTTYYGDHPLEFIRNLKKIY